MMDDASKSLVSHKIKTADEIAKLIGARPRAKKVVMCHGTFDIVHPGHVRHLLYAKSKGDLLVASLTADAHIAKANFRPFVPQELRAFNLAALEVVDFVVIDHLPTPIENIKVIKPDYFAKGYEYVKGGLPPRTADEKTAVESYGGEILFTPGDIVYSSSHIIETEPPAIATEKLLSLLQAEKLSFDSLKEAAGKLKDIRVHVIGDTIVDSYTHTVLIGGMTKTPTMSVRFENRKDFVGGAGIVAKHLRAAGAKVTYSTVLGNDKLAEFALDDLKEAGVECVPIIDPTRPTTNKNAIIAGGYNLLKVDTLDNRSISERVVETLKSQVEETPADIVVFSDFRHGMFNRDTIPGLTAAIPKDAFRVADSQVASRWGNILEFQGFDLITPNEREARFALGDQDSVVRPLGLELYKQAHCKTLILKLGERGLMTFRSIPEEEQDVRAFFAVDTFAERIVDAVGSGDALLAYAALSLFSTGSSVIASVLGSLAAAVECEHEGNVPVRPKDVIDKLERFERFANYA
ncbi:PfkB family carbohydrate kinase [Pseudolabrys sp. FHR47]|uniref:PfkB family carbohydrate kinase n=1 Tax=Pseudolabrys sp. FHR47 TaxID=2562284 RepID=UPI0010BE657F|nr:PfkB family carbohydrate kinase [Pseudolabrys sp. FHR47]